MLRYLLDSQINNLKSEFERGDSNVRPILSTTKSLYLIGRYGLKR